MPNVNKIVNQNIRAINTVLIVSVYEMPKLSSSLFTHILQPPTKIVGKAENERLDYNKI